MLALFGTCMVLSLQARSDDQPQTISALAPEHHLLIPAMKVDAFSGSRAILISGSGAEIISLENIPRQSAPTRQSAPVQRVDIGVCFDYVVDILKLPGGSR